MKSSRRQEIEVALHVKMGERRMKLTELSRATGIDYTTLHRLYHGKSKGIRFATLASICRVLGCDVGDILKLSG